MFNPKLHGYQVEQPENASTLNPNQIVDAEMDEMPFDAEHPGEDEELWPGGPYLSQITSWKKQFGEGNVFLSEIAGDFYVWRTLNRFEYKQIIGMPGTDPLQREEMICETCVLWPQPFNYEVQAGLKAGVPARLAELIMEHSGFTRDTQTRIL